MLVVDALELIRDTSLVRRDQVDTHRDENWQRNWINFWTDMWNVASLLVVMMELKSQPNTPKRFRLEIYDD